MKTLSIVGVAAALFGAAVLFAGPVLAQQKTVKACEEEWRANKKENQDKGITEKAYVEKCRGGQATAAPAAPAKPEPAAAAPKATPAAAPAGQKTVKACEEEWRANKKANQDKGITEKAYVEKCRAGDAVAVPQKPEPAPAPKTTATPAAPPPPAAPPAPAQAAPKPTPAAAPAAPGSATATTLASGQYPTEAQAKSRCGSDLVVWANLDSKIYHFSGHPDYGHTKEGAYMCEKGALAQGIRAAKNEKRPQ